MSKNSGLYAYAYDKVDVAKVMDAYHFQYERRGSELWMCCPFHSEMEPSFAINEANKFFTCWGCHEHGNIFSLVQKLDTISKSSEVSYYDAVMKCCKICHIKVKDSDLEQYASELDDDISDLIEFGEQADETFEPIVFVETALNKFKRRTHGYFRDRGFKQSTLDYLEMGFLSGDKKDPMNNRCVFPIRTVDGKLIGWTGRTVMTGVEPKWVHAPAKKFKKFYCLYNIDKAISYIQETGEINVVESVANAARMIEAGHYNTVATLGAGISRYQFELLTMYARRVVFWYDWDNGGFEGIQLALSYTMDYDSIFVAVTDYGKNDNGKSLDLGDVDNATVNKTVIITAYEFLSFMERRFVSTMNSEFERDTKMEMPDGTTFICKNKIQPDADIPQLLPEEVLFIQNIDHFFGVRKTSIYKGDN